VKKCPQCHALYSDDDMTICPKCGADLEIVNKNIVLAENPAPVVPDPDHVKVMTSGAFAYAVTAVLLSAGALGFALIDSLVTNIFFVIFVVFAWIPFGASIRAAGRAEQRDPHHHAGFGVRIIQLLVLLVQVAALVVFIV